MGRDEGVNLLIEGDNLDIMSRLSENPEICGKIKLIYIDPPFYTKAKYDARVLKDGRASKKLAYEDIWHSIDEYLAMMKPRLSLMKELLAEDGLIYLHGDWHAIHYLKVAMDEIFGEGNFVNEIIWHYKSGGSTKRHFARKHDNILVYAKSKKYRFFPQKEKSYNRGLKAYRFKGVEEFEDEVGWYTVVNMKDVWTIDMVGRTSQERTGYATQKPIKLMERIILSCTKEGDLCADFFCGSGSFGVACGLMGRNFIMCDNGDLAISMSEKRLADNNIEFIKTKDLY